MACTSPNFNERPNGAMPSMLMLHYTGMPTAKEAIDRLSDPEAGVSAHYVIEEDVTIHAMVDEQKRAWHAGISYWRGVDDTNNVSIGIEVVNPGHEFGYRDFPDKQVEAIITLCKQIVKRWDIKPWNVVAHSDVAPERKEDPGERFPWKKLAEAGIGMWEDPSVIEEGFVPMHFGNVGENVQSLQERLQKLGYYMKIDSFYGQRTEKAVIAFQRHFIQTRVDGVWDATSEAVLRKLLTRLP